MRIDPRINMSVQTMHVGSRPSDIAYGEGAVWIADSGDSTVTRIDPRTGTSRSASRPRLCEPPRHRRRRRLGDERGSGRRQPRRSQTGAVVDTIVTGSAAGAVAAGEGAVWDVNRQAPCGGSTPPPTSPSQRSSSTRVRTASLSGVWVGNEHSGTLTRIDATTTDSVAQIVMTGNRPEGIGAFRAR